MLGLDIGGANLKIADGCGYADVRPFPLWKYPERLADELRRMIDSAPQFGSIAITMTGELADCFASKREGVRSIVDAACAAAGDRRLLVYTTDGSLVSAEEAKQAPRRVAASNWHALARFAGRFLGAEEPGVLLDIGSTTTDIIPLRGARVVTSGRTDTERLLAGELVYTGVARSPLCALVHELDYNGVRYPLCQELFATARDAYLMLDAVPEAPEDMNTADGRPATKAAAYQRLARMVAAWEDEFDLPLAQALAEECRRTQRTRIAAALQRVLRRLGSPRGAAILAGEGEFLAREALQLAVPHGRCIALSEQIGRHVSRVAPAHALAVLAREADPC